MVDADRSFVSFPLYMEFFALGMHTLGMKICEESTSQALVLLMMEKAMNRGHVSGNAR